MLTSRTTNPNEHIFKITNASGVAIFRLLGEWEKAKSDLATACKIDWDDQADEWWKAAAPNVCFFNKYCTIIQQPNPFRVQDEGSRGKGRKFQKFHEETRKP
jgi:suppressor of tumorigenicity protein 13